MMQLNLVCRSMCTGHMCRWRKNQNETDVDCKGVCGDSCLAGQKCGVGKDCQAANCTQGEL